MSVTELKTPIPMVTPKGKGMANFVIDYGMEHDLLWVVFLRDEPHAGEIFTFSNKVVRVEENYTIGREATISPETLDKIDPNYNPWARYGTYETRYPDPNLFKTNSATTTTTTTTTPKIRYASASLSGSASDKEDVISSMLEGDVLCSLVKGDIEIIAQKIDGKLIPYPLKKG